MSRHIDEYKHLDSDPNHKIRLELTPTATNWRVSMTREDLEAENASLRGALSAWQEHAMKFEDQVVEKEREKNALLAELAAVDAVPPSMDGSAFWTLFEHMSQNHGLTLLDTELSDICHAVDTMRAEWKAKEDKS